MFAFVSASVNAIKVGVRSIKNSKLVSSTQSGAQPCSTVNQCFIAGTLVACLDEEGNEITKPIEDIKVGDKVLAFDEKTGEQAYKSVVRLFRNETKEWCHIFANGEEIICTGGHPFYVVGVGFVEARKLKELDNLLLSDGKPIIIETIELEELSSPETTYNFEVIDYHTYYVSDSKVLVHNMCTVDINNTDIVPDLGNKLDYAFGKATGSEHNVLRSMNNASQLSKIGIYDNGFGRQILGDHLKSVFYANQSTIMNATGRATVNSLLAGPGGFLGVRSIWEGNKLITLFFLG